ncbi:hypothetical protein VPNG_08591 [Cytospora leucostoma]|uniref:NPP1 domain-containing protein n=1 Tax=Cytospora leucostoma TaxID=1230097 RepID=A0A423W4A9_9PEZI|nr:hypothetical protein VPNG_08591 [Cytospora leucostoma]
MPGLRSLLTVAAAAAITTATPIERRGAIAHDKVVGFSQTVPSGTTGDVYLAYQPYLYVINGCVPFPAVDEAGDTSAGLNPSGSSSGKCSSSTGQLYVRAAEYNNYYALLYSWYFPKDEPSPGIGHRHDWEGTIVWLKSSTDTSAGNIVAVCPSAHGGWECTTNGYTLSGTKPLIKSESAWPLDHSLGQTTKEGGAQPLIAWESLPPAAQDALQSADFGSAIVPFKDSTFNANLAKATF